MAFGNVGALLSDSAEAESQFHAMSATLELGGADRSIQRKLIENDCFVGLFQSTIATTSEGPPPASPGIHVVADIRLDNRRELIESLLDGDADTPSDECLVAAAYQRWGIDCARHLRGDFAFVVWDPNLRQLLAVRDIFGVRGLLYSRDGDRTLVASTVAGLLAGHRRRPKHNFEYLRQFVQVRFSGQVGPTAFESIHWIPGGHQLVARNGDVRVHRYDTLQPKSLPRTADTLREFRAHLEAAVESRLRAAGPVAMMVSGGFDSSAIACLANEAVDRGRCEVGLRAYSATFERCPDADERSYLRATMARCGHVTAIELPCDDVLWSVDSVLGDDGFPLEEPAQAPRILGVALSQMARRDGCRVILRGTWADQLLIRPAYFSPQLLWDLPLRRARSEWRYFYQRVGAKRMALGAARGWSRRLARALSHVGIGEKPLTASQALIAARVTSANDHRVLTFNDRVARWIGAEIRYPYLDRDLYELVLGLAAECFFADGRNKRLLRVGLADVLPGMFQTRTTFSNITHVFVEGMKRERSRIASRLRAPMLLEAGLLSAAERRRLLDGLNSNEQLPAYVARIQHALAAEAWLQRESGQPVK